MLPLNLPEYPFIIRGDKRKEIFDVIRKKYVALTPEEWVRQHFLTFLVKEKEYPASLILIEQNLKVLQLSRRCDAVIYSTQGLPLMIAEFKAPGIALTQKVFDQIARYNFALGVRYLCISNGLQHYCCITDDHNKNWTFAEEIPAYEQLTKNI